jgi:hypothetical protein
MALMLIVLVLVKETVRQLTKDNFIFGTSISKRGTHRRAQALETAIKQYVELSNESPKPFIWTKTADDILASGDSVNELLRQDASRCWPTHNMFGLDALCVGKRL